MYYKSVIYHYLYLYEHDLHHLNLINTCNSRNIQLKYFLITNIKLHGNRWYEVKHFRF